MPRPLITRLAAAFPPKSVSDRLLPYVTLVLAVAAGTSALVQYGNNLAIARVSASLDLHKQFLSETFQKAKKEFAAFDENVGAVAATARCEFIRNEVAKGALPAPAGVTLDCENLTDSMRIALQSIDIVGEQRTRLRDYVLSKVRDRLSGTDGLAQLEIFFRSVIICVGRSNCDGETAAALFARDMVTFVNATCVFDPPIGQDDTTNDEIARFLVRWRVNKNIYWNRDPGREKLFACDRQRALEK